MKQWLLQYGVEMTLACPQKALAIINYGFNACNGLKNMPEEDLRDLFGTIERTNRNLNANQQV